MAETRVLERQKRIVHSRARGFCEYCRSPRRYSIAPFSVEHIWPVVREGDNSLDNLALACQGCNGHKHAKIEGVDPMTLQSARLFHPRRQKWAEHFIWSNDYRYIIGRTATGRATVEALQLNREGVVNLRALLFVTGEHPPPELDEM